MIYRLDGGTLSWKEEVERRGDWVLDTLVGWPSNYIAIFVIGRRLRRVISVLRRSRWTSHCEETLAACHWWFCAFHFDQQIADVPRYPQYQPRARVLVAGTFHSSSQTTSWRSVTTSLSFGRPHLSVLPTTDALKCAPRPRNASRRGKVGAG
ncbi:hypothetical protein BDN67DRAFT_573580 [Paxillus ammoniavirescens]|nr:hypothetical protein BDN67DRAFT_573580 [Paxillus ammoniavirescens]